MAVKANRPVEVGTLVSLTAGALGSNQPDPSLALVVGASRTKISMVTTTSTVYGNVSMVVVKGWISKRWMQILVT